MSVAIEESWLKVLNDEFEKPYMKSLKAALLEEKQKGFSKKGAFYYKINEEKYKKQFNTFLNFLPGGNV